MLKIVIIIIIIIIIIIVIIIITKKRDINAREYIGFLFCISCVINLKYSILRFLFVL